MLSAFLIVAVLVLLVVVLVGQLTGSTRVNTRIDEFNRQIGAQTEQGDLRIHKPGSTDSYPV